MAFRPNYRFERAERDRAKKAKKEEKLKKRQQQQRDGSDPDIDALGAADDPQKHEEPT